MVWGALAGTIPDLDVTAGCVADPVTSLAFHRCVTHSLFYAALASPVLAWMARALYPDGADRPGRDFPWRVWLPGALLIYVILVAGSALSPTPLRGIWGYSAVVAGVTVAFPLVVWGFRQIWARDYGPREGYRHWLALFALGIGTHPLLDCFTTYGTQIFQPFTELRVAWNTISVVDPAYTLPFLVCLLVASRMLRHSPRRRAWTWAGVAISSAYLLFTCFNLWRVRSQVAEDLAEAGIVYERFTATPTLFQNVLWQVTLDQGDTLRTGRLGLLDEPFALDVTQLRAFPQRRDLTAPIDEERGVQVAQWFADGYQVAWKGAGDTVNLADLRFGMLPGEGTSPLFVFQLYPRGPGEEWGFRQRPIRTTGVGDMIGELWARVRGREEIEVGVPEGMRGRE